MSPTIIFRKSVASLPDAALKEAVRHGAVLTIDLAAIKENFRRLQTRLGRVPCAAVVKADAYGLGARQVAPALANAGARSFFVAPLAEGIALRQHLAQTAPEAEIYVLNGFIAGAAEDYLTNALRPVLNSLGEIEAWQALARAKERRLAAAIHIDTGMCRLGLPGSELAVLQSEPDRLAGIDLRYWISHLAVAEAPAHPMNEAQRITLERSLAGLPAAPVSFANSSGIFLPAQFHYQLGRPGAALYGVNPQPEHPNPMAQVVTLKGRILQVREVDAPQTVGYGASHTVSAPGGVATVAVGYADGYFRSLSNRGSVYIGKQRVSVLGRVSMDLITIDISDVDRSLARPGEFVELIGENLGQDELAARAGTIGYEILTSLGHRYHRVYLDD